MILPFKKPKPHKTREGKIALTMKAHGIDTVLDIGANKGIMAETLRANGFAGDIISVEPLPSLQPTLQAKAARDPRWTALPPLALGENNGETLINLSEADDLSSILPPAQAMLCALPKTQVIKSVTVPMKTLDTLYEELDLSGKKVFAKIDTQGYEMRILRNAENALKHLTGLHVEMSLLELYEGETLFDEVIAFLKARGFMPYMLFDTTFSRDLGRQLQLDGIFYRQETL